MSAETLREAAALMRERAEAAGTVHPGAWRPMGAGSVVYQMTRTMSGVVAHTSPIGGSADQVATTEHIASWHPAVALAVADWLDGVALLLEGREEEEWSDLDGDPISPEDTHAIGSALTVARAYLGSAS